MPFKGGDGVIKIGEFAKICNTSTQTLRYYDAEDILKADYIDTDTGYRFYAPEAVEKYKKIMFYKELGFTLDEIRRLMLLPPDEVSKMLLVKKDEIESTVKRLAENADMIADICMSPENEYLPKDNLLDLPFVDDPRVVGKWELCGQLADGLDLRSAGMENIHDSVQRQLIFLPGGAFWWIYFWTKGILYRMIEAYNFAVPNYYEITEQDGEKYMILQYMTNECIDNAQDPIILLYRQSSAEAYTENQIRHIDKTDLPFTEDAAVIGEWTVCDFVGMTNDFDPESPHCTDEDLVTRRLSFLHRGVCIKTVHGVSGDLNFLLRYTKGFVLNQKNMTAEEYLIKTVMGREYLFVQHKSGDYTYGGRTPCWYVFSRKER